MSEFDCFRRIECVAENKTVITRLTKMNRDEIGNIIVRET
jgi:hypothetical protein